MSNNILWEWHKENIQKTGVSQNKERGKVSNGTHLIQKLKNPKNWQISPSIKLIIVHFHPQHYLNHNNLVRKNNERNREKLQNIYYTQRTENKGM
jgi:hypothetical protein